MSDIFDQVERQLGRKTATQYVWVIILVNFVIWGIALACGLAWLTHLISTFLHHNWGFMFWGALFFPIGIFHGFGVWLGIWVF